MAPRHKNRFWRLCRIYFRRFRITVWLIILTLLGALIYLNQVGLPNFIKQPLLDKVRERGLNLRFSRLRLRWYQGIVADNVSFGRADELQGPRLNVAEIRLLLDYRALLQFQLQVQALALRQGRLSWTAADTNQSSRELSIDGIQTDLRFLPNDQWALDNFKARFAGANIQLTGVITNASAIRDWKFFRTEAPATESTDLWPDRLRQFEDLLGELHFSAPPELRFDVRGDARNPRSFQARLLLAASDAATPWGTISQGRLTARLFPADTNGFSHADLRLEAADAQNHWAAITNFGLALHLTAVEGRTNLIDGDLRLWTRQVQTGWGGGSNVLFTARWVHSLTNPVPLSGSGQLECDHAFTPWGAASQIRLTGKLSAPSLANQSSPDPSWGWWTNLQPYALDCECQLAQLQTADLIVDQAACEAHWRAPRLILTNLNARLYQGNLATQADLDVASRVLQLHLISEVDPHKLSPVLGEVGRRFLAPLSWESAPKIDTRLSLVLPAWTNRQPDWRAEVQPTLIAQGEFKLDHGAAYREIQFTAAHSHFSYSNLCWYLPDLAVERPDGNLLAVHRADERTREYSWHITSTLDPQLLRPLLETNQQRAFEFFTLSQPPAIEAEIHGRFHEPDTIGVNGSVALTNFTMRGQPCASLQTRLQYTNHLLRILEPRLRCGTGQISADGLAADFDAQLIYLTNGFSTAEPMLVARAIGPNIVRAIEAYQFLRPPVARVRGTIPLRGEERADLHFDLAGGPFHWWKFNVPYLTGQVHWAGQTLTLSNVNAEFYGGKAAGSAAFNFRPKRGTEFQFALASTNVLLHSLMADLSTHTNNLEGWLTGGLTVTRANSEDWQTVNGFGNLDLRDGVIWDIPLFGIFSPVLNGISPGLGNSRANAGACTFAINNGVIRSEDLEIHSTAMWLKYRGTVDLQNQVTAKVEAQLLRDMWLVGPLVSTVLWPVTKLFEYKVSGTLADPKSEPVNPIPKLVLFPFHPFRTLKGLLPEEPGPFRTNSFSPLPP